MKNWEPNIQPDLNTNIAIYLYEYRRIFSGTFEQLLGEAFFNAFNCRVHVFFYIVVFISTPKYSPGNAKKILGPCRELRSSLMAVRPRWATFWTAMGELATTITL